ncbi:MAG: dockerin type I domain-containing protein, partial [Oscillospiraceae bacterium]
MLSLKKKISTLILLGIITTTSISTMTVSSQENVGDLNGDGIINFKDIQLLKMDLLCENNNSFSNEDINGDGAINVLDVCNMKHDILYSSSSDIPDYGTPMDETATSIADFRKGTSSMFIASDGWG